LFVLSAGEGKKGGNSVASMLWKMFKMKGLLDARKPANEINLVFDNCAGQNKNKMVYRMLFFMVKLKVCRTANAIFLVKGHTKNDCDRMFNLMKYDYRKVDCFSPPELLEIANKHPHVHAVAMNTDEFKDWNELEDKMIRLLKSGVKKNHVFTVKAKDSNTMMVQEYGGAPVTRELLVNEPFRDVDWRSLFQLQAIVPPGLPDIKWNELYSKWGKFVPENRKPGLKYFMEKPPVEVKKRIAEQSAQAKAVRATRSRGPVAEPKKKKRKTKQKSIP
jgi:hypothetical protein